MRVLIVGARGFVGHALERHLSAIGHTVIRALRQPEREGDIRINYSEIAPKDWKHRLVGVQAVINCAGLLVESEAKRFDYIHRCGPQALFLACAGAGVCRVIQVSALGAADGKTPYFVSKRAADDFLKTLPLDWRIVRPSLVVGINGQSSKLFRLLASLPVIPLPDGGRQPFRLLHIDDLCAAIATLLGPETHSGRCFDLVGDTETTLRGLLSTYRQLMGFPAAVYFSVPVGLMEAIARLAGLFPGSLLNLDTWRMLQAGSTTDVGPTVALLGRRPRPLSTFMNPEEAAYARLEALAGWRSPLLRATLALIWAAGGVLSAVVHPFADSLSLLARAGIAGWWAWIVLYAASILDIALAWASLALPSRRLWLLQSAVICVYSVIIMVKLPEFLTHPFGPVVKNLAILGLLAVLFAEETRS